MSRPSQQWLLTTVNAVRDLVVRRLQEHSLDGDTERDLQMALEELEVVWEELEGQNELLKREHQRYAEFFDHAPDAYLITDAGGTIREANLAAAELLGAPRETLADKALSDFVAEEDRVTFLSRFVGAAMPGSEGASPAAWPCRVRSHRGEALACTFSVRPIPLKKSGVGGLCWLVRAD